MLIVCNNWSEIVKVVLIFRIRTNSPITCFSMKNLQKDHCYIKGYEWTKFQEYKNQEVSLKEGRIMLVAKRY